MKIIKIKRIEWYDPKIKSDAVTWKVWLDNNGQVKLKYFTDLLALEDFQKSLEPKRKKAKQSDNPAV